MIILNSMTGATPETRLVLIIWIAIFGNRSRAGTGFELDAFGLSKRHLKEALEYLYREGYLWKTKSFPSPAQKVKPEAYFDFGITADCWNMWSESLSTCNSWVVELRYVLTNAKLLNSKSNEKSNSISATMRLVWAVLICKANEEGYVMEQNSQVLSGMLGMDEGRFKRTLRALAKTGCISVAANGAASSVLFNQLEPIYKIHPRRPELKIIKLAVPVFRNEITPFRFFNKLKDAGNRARKGRFPDFFEISNKHCCELSKIICSSRFSATLHQLGMSIILPLLPKYAAVRYQYVEGGVDMISNEQRTTLRNTLKSDIGRMLSAALLDSPIHEGDRSITEKKLFTESDIVILKYIVLSEITNDMFWIIEELWLGWQIYTDSTSGSIQLVNCAFEEHKVDINKKNDGLEAKEQPSDFNETEGKVKNFVVPVGCILDVCVPNDSKHNDCVVISDELWTTNSRVRGPKIQHVEQLVIR